MRRVGLLDLALVVLAFLFYSAVREMVAGRESEATAHALRLVELEQSLGVWREGALQEFTLSSTALTKAFNWVYAYGFFPPIYAIGLYLFFFKRERFVLFRNAFLISGALGLLVFQLYPMAPPRLVPWPYGLVDTLSAFSKVNYHTESAFVNEYAAMPSLHAGWNLLICVAFIGAVRNPGLKALGFILPVLMAISVMVTGNHFVLDIVAGYVVAGIGLAAAVALRDRGWKLPRLFSSGGGEAEVPA